MNKPLTHDEVVRLVGDVKDSKIAEILASGCSYAELEEAVAWAQDETDVLGEAERPLSGMVSRLHEILTADEEEAMEADRS